MSVFCLTDFTDMPFFVIIKSVGFVCSVCSVCSVRLQPFLIGFAEKSARKSEEKSKKKN